jgi:hypothetical protein
MGKKAIRQAERIAAAKAREVTEVTIVPNTEAKPFKWPGVNGDPSVNQMNAGARSRFAAKRVLRRKMRALKLAELGLVTPVPATEEILSRAIVTLPNGVVLCSSTP